MTAGLELPTGTSPAATAAEDVGEQLAEEIAAVVTEHDALPRSDLNRRRLRAYADGLLRALNLCERACGGPGKLTLAGVASRSPAADALDLQT